MGACYDFLSVADEKLDTGLSKPLRDRALAAGSERKSLEFLCSDPVQDALKLCFLATMISSLPVERRHAELKRWETSRLVHVATASRNALLNRFLRQRTTASELLAAARKEVERLNRMGISQLALEHRPDLKPEGRAFAPAAAGAEAAAAGARGIKVRRHDKRAAGTICAVSEKRRAEALNAYKTSCQAELKDELAARRSTAKRNVVALTPRLPTTREDMMKWMVEHETCFRSRMKTAGRDRRRVSHRLHEEVRMFHWNCIGCPLKI